MVRRLRQNRADDLATNIRQSEVAALVAVGEALVVDAELVQDRGMQVMDVDDVLGGMIAKFVGRAVRDAGLDAAAGEPH